MDFVGAGRQKAFRGCFQGRSRCQHIIDEPDTASWLACFLCEAKRAAQIGTAGVASLMGLGLGGPQANEHVGLDADAGDAAEAQGDERTLIEAPRALAARVQRDWDDEVVPRVERAMPRELVSEELDSKSCGKGRAKGSLPSLKALDRLLSITFVSKGRPCAVER